MPYKGNHFDCIIQIFTQLFLLECKKIGVSGMMCRFLVVRLRIIIKIYIIPLLYAGFVCSLGRRTDEAGSDTFSRTNNVFGVGIDYKF